jgi:divalent metal cation (Fe/Co/Zn/Cd) transporter
MGIIKQSFYELTDSNFIDQYKLEDIEAQIKGIPGLMLESIQIRTTGNRLDAMVSISIDEQNSMYGASDFSNQVKALVAKRFPTFATNVMIFFNLAISINKQGKDFLLDIIRMEGNHVDGISNIHQVSIDQFKDSILVQYHLHMNPRLTLQEAHKVSTILEDRIALKIREIMQNISNIEVISHIEPATSQKKIHSHKVIPSTSLPEIRKKIQDRLCLFSEIRGITTVKAFSESEGLYISLAIVLDPLSLVENVHLTTEKVEHALYLAFPELKRLIIHVEPERNSSEYIEFHCPPK